MIAVQWTHQLSDVHMAQARRFLCHRKPSTRPQAGWQYKHYPGSARIVTERLMASWVGLVIFA